MLDHPLVLTYVAWTFCVVSFLAEYFGFAADGFFAASGSILVGSAVLSEILITHHSVTWQGRVDHLREIFRGVGTDEHQMKIDEAFSGIDEQIDAAGKTTLIVTVLFGSVIWGYGHWWI